MIGGQGLLKDLSTLFDAGTAVEEADGALLERFLARGDEAAFAAIVARHGPMVAGVCRRLLHDPRDVEDAFQATFLVLVEKARSLRDRDRLGCWLYGVAYRVASRARANAARRRERERPGAEDVAMGPSHDPERRELFAALDQEVTRLPERFRAVVVLCDLGGQTHEEAARRLGCPVGTIKSRLSTARGRLRGRLFRRGLDPSAWPRGAGFPPAWNFSGVPASLAESTIKAATRSAAGGSAAGAVAALTRETSNAMLRNQAGKTIAAMLTLGALVVGAGMIVRTGKGKLPQDTPRDGNPSGREDPGPGDARRDVPANGVVKDENGRPVEGAEVVMVLRQFVASTPSGPLDPLVIDRKVVTTGPDGRFRASLAGRKGPDGYVEASAQTAGRASFRVVRPLEERIPPPPAPDLPSVSKARVRNIRDGTHAPAGDFNLVVEPTEPFVGVVKDHVGRPIAGAKILVQAARRRNPDGTVTDFFSGTAGATTADQHGRFQFLGLPSGARLWLRVSTKGRPDLLTRDFGEPRPLLEGFLAGTAADPAQVVLLPGVQVVGRVSTKLPGVDVGGLTVFLQGCGDSASDLEVDTTTDASGRFELAGLHEATVNIFLVGHPGDGPWTYRAVREAVLRSGEPNEVSIELIEGVLAEGTVVDAETEAPVAGVEVGISGPIRPRSGASFATATTDKEGRYRYRLPPGETYVSIFRGPSGSSALPGAGSSRRVDIPGGVKAFTIPPIMLEANAPSR